MFIRGDLYYWNEDSMSWENAGMDTIISLEQIGTAFFTSYDTTYAIDIKKQGAYQINYFFNVALALTLISQFFLRLQT